MLDLARVRFPDQDLRVGNAVDLRGLPAAAYDLVVFSFNGWTRSTTPTAARRWPRWRG